MDRRRFVLASLGAAAVAGTARAQTTRIEVFKSPTCGCCTAWVRHMEAGGFAVTAREIDDDALWTLKMKSGIAPELASCHTAFVDGYVIEGHVPAGDVQRLLAERPTALGLTVPGMPIGSPGMEMGDRREAFATLAILRGGGTRVFQRHG